MFQSIMVDSFIKGLDPIDQKSISLNPGQIFNGKIIKIYPGQLATLIMNGVTLTAKLEAALIVGKRYWFQVEPGDGIPKLKVIESVRENGKSDSRASENLFSRIGVLSNRLTETVINYLAKEEIAFSVAQMKHGVEILQNVKIPTEEGLAILKVLIERDLPITSETFLAVKSVIEGKGLSIQLHELSEMLQVIKENHPVLQQLHHTIQIILKEATIKGDQNEVNHFPTKIAMLITRIGLQYERDVLQSIIQNGENREEVLLQVKSLLIKSQQIYLPSKLQEKINSILHRITAQQLLSVNHEGPITNYAVAIPLVLSGIPTDLSIQWQGKKQRNGELDPDHCRILFYINLEHLKETVIDVQIQNRIVSLHIINENVKPIKLISYLQPLLKEGLLNLDYQLSSIKWTQSIQSKTKDKKNVLHQENTYVQTSKAYQGVDIRI
ncbi:hypothetical protein BKP45_19845 [Anaerobacillus alkalidiazotrophicus]|uniref:Flagellar hook-length control protein-like C-terminal domain-containing protein n=1 Tax=Anaerobacillus alkalidiazotrophicus TaxID=472963 RepID=A0A1S2LZD4_9BACI|nr:hypothetical protein [Anaerobacillus alkalidiazotrophicus]OIJ17818.1 hypothetical protein BKP45_19845 [Anaerobacillus alkalidiazotrophicus]